jgi:DNA-binding SARP family transcriptional activator
VARDCATAGESELARLLDAMLELLRAFDEQHAALEARHRIETRMRTTGRHPAGGTAGAAALTVYCLGPMQVYRDGRLLEPWPNRRAKSVFKYLVTHRPRPVPKEHLMDWFWPDAQQGAARNNLNVAIHGLRRFLRAGDGNVSHILFKGDCYMLNPALALWVDIEEFDRWVAIARRDSSGASTMAPLEAAEALYRGPLFEDEPFDEWCSGLRRSLQDTYLDVLERLRDYGFRSGDYAACVTAAHKILALEPAHEKSHRTLMRCYARQGRYSLALRQFQDYVGDLRATLDLPPSELATQLYARIRRQEPV